MECTVTPVVTVSTTVNISTLVPASSHCRQHRWGTVRLTISYAIHVYDLCCWNENASINLWIFKYIWSNLFVQLIYLGRKKKKKQHSNNHNTTHQYINPYVMEKNAVHELPQSALAVVHLVKKRSNQHHLPKWLETIRTHIEDSSLSVC